MLFLLFYIHDHSTNYCSCSYRSYFDSTWIYFYSLKITAYPNRTWLRTEQWRSKHFSREVKQLTFLNFSSPAGYLTERHCLFIQNIFCLI